MKASVKLQKDHGGRVHKTPVVKAKLPFDLLGFPVQAGFTACGHIQELALRLSCTELDSGPSVEVAYRPHEHDRRFTVSFKTGFSPWPSSPASALTMAAEFNLSRPSNPSFLLRLKPQLGDFSLCHDFRTAIFGNGGSGGSNSHSDGLRHGHDEATSDVGFTNAFARYATKLAENPSFPWNDGARNEICDAVHRYDAANNNANLASFDSTPYASDRASFSMIDLVNFRSEHPTPVRISTEEKRLKDMNQHASDSTGWGSRREKVHNKNFAAVPKMDDCWEHVIDGASPGITSVSSSTLQSRDGSHIRRRRRSQCSSLISGRISHGFSGSGQLHARTRLPISPEAHFKIRWSLSVSSSPSILPLLLLDKITLESVAPATQSCRTPLLSTLSKASKDEGQLDVASDRKQTKSLMTLMQREKGAMESSSAYSGSEGYDGGNEMDVKNVDSKKPSFIGLLLHGKGPLH